MQAGICDRNEDTCLARAYKYEGAMDLPRGDSISAGHVLVGRTNLVTHSPYREKETQINGCSSMANMGGTAGIRRGSVGMEAVIQMTLR